MQNNIRKSKAAYCATAGPLLYKIGEAARLLSISATSVRRLIDRGELVAIRKLRHVLITAQSVQQLVASGTAGVAAKEGR
jgi:excisionase family DNA binding protein